MVAGKSKRPDFVSAKRVTKSKSQESSTREVAFFYFQEKWLPYSSL